MYRLALALLALSVSACSLDSFRSRSARQSQADPASTEYASQLDVDMSHMTKTDSGLHYQDLVTGSGSEAAPGREVLVHYIGWLPNGKKFDSSRDSGQPFSFRLGAGMVIRGWDEGVAGMKVGGQRKLVIPPQLGYGAQDLGVIPPNSTLVFDVELLEVR